MQKEKSTNQKQNKWNNFPIENMRRVSSSSIHVTEYENHESDIKNKENTHGKILAENSAGINLKISNFQ